MPLEIPQRRICGEFVKLLRKERVQRGLSIYAVAARSGLSQQSVSYIERGMRLPSFETIMRIADSVGIDFADVLKRARTAAAKSDKG